MRIPPIRRIAHFGQIYLMVVLATLIGVLGSITVATPTGAATLTIPATTSCAQPNPANGLLTLEPSGGELPVGASATLEASGGALPLKKGTNVTFIVICGPNVSTSGQAAVNVHPSSYPPNVPSAYFTYSDKNGPGTDLVSATTNHLGQQATVTARVSWVQPVDCGSLYRGGA